MILPSHSKFSRTNTILCLIILSLCPFLISWWSFSKYFVAKKANPTYQQSRSPDPNEFSYLIIHYHKTGHHLSHSLLNFISEEVSTGPRVIIRESAVPRRAHSSETKCPENIILPSGVIQIIIAPNFFCDASFLLKILQGGSDGNDTHSRSRRSNYKRKGLKIIHLVRNPFSMAISNYNYHAQYPTPESWVHLIDPCKEEKFHGQSYMNLLQPTLSHLIEYNDFQNLHDKCVSIFQNPQHPKLEHASFYEHLLILNPQFGVQLSTLHMLTQGSSGGDILRMVNNIIKLNEVCHLFHETPNINENEHGIEIMSMSVDDFIIEPKVMALHFVDFIFGITLSQEIKEKIAAKYELSYIDLMNDVNSKHVTNANINTELLNVSLQNDKLIGRVLGNLESLVEQVLLESQEENLYRILGQ